MDRGALLPKVSKFNSQYQNVVLGIQTLRRKNDQYQRMSVEEIDDSIVQEIQQNQKIMVQQIDKTKKLIKSMQQNFKEPHHRNKLKEIKRQFEKQTERHKIIMQNFSKNQTYRRMSTNLKDSSQNKKYYPKNNQNLKKSSIVKSQANKSSSQLSDSLIQQQKEDFYFEERLMKQKSQQIAKLEKRFENLHDIHIQTANLVYQQGENIDIIGQQLKKAKQNTQNANQQLDEAKLNQKKSKKKYIILIICILIIAGTVAGVILIQT